MVIDTFLFFNEKELLELRLKYLNSVVDYFVIIEADITHQGRKKPWNLEKHLENNLAEFKDKIVYVKKIIDVDKIFKEENLSEKDSKLKSWKIENYHRDSIKENLENFKDDDIVLISDLDEIPSIEKILFLKTCELKKIQPVVFEQKLFHLNCNYLTLTKWFGTIAIQKVFLRKYSPQFLRNNANQMSVFANAGWSFSSFGGKNRVIEKLEAFAHTEFNNNDFKDENHIELCTLFGGDFFKRGEKRKKVDKSYFPGDLLKLLNENQKFYFG